MMRILYNPGIRIRMGLVGSNLLGDRVRCLVVFRSVDEQGRERIIVLLHLIVWDLIQAGTIEHREELQNLQGRMTRKIDLVVNVVVKRVRLQ